MRTQVLYTFPSTFPEYPNIKPALSSLQPGPEGIFGLAVEPVVNHQTKDTVCSFYEINLLKGAVAHFTMRLPYVSIFQMQPCYDHSRGVWALAIEGGAFKKPFDIYQLPQEVDGTWTKLFEGNNHEREFEVEKSLVAFWQQDHYYPLIFCELDLTMMYDTDLRWTSWRAMDAQQSVHQYLATSYEWLPYIAEAGCLLFTCQCVYDQPLGDELYRKKGSGQWQFMVSAYAHSGELLQQTQIPSASFPIRDQKVASNDRFEWLLLSMNAVAGPRSTPEGPRTCVAALVMQDNPDRLRAIKKKPPLAEQRPAQSRGGLYCLDMQGRLLYHDPGLLGEQISMCACGDLVVGTVLHNGQRDLWSWRPFSGAPHAVYMQIPPNARRATVIAGPELDAGNVPWCWCVEEYEHGVRVSQRTCDHLQEVQTLWCEGITLPNGWTGSLILEQKPQGLVPFHDTLLLLAMNQQKQLQLLQFQ